MCDVHPGVSSEQIFALALFFDAMGSCKDDWLFPSDLCNDHHNIKRKKPAAVVIVNTLHESGQLHACQLLLGGSDLSQAHQSIVGTFW